MRLCNGLGSLLLCILCFGNGEVARAGSSVRTVELGNTVVSIKVYDYGPGPIYFAPHDNENTAVAAAKTVVAESGGKLIELSYGGTRNISFALKGKKYVFDPNRMFTSRGLKASLNDLGNTYSIEAEKEANKLGLAVLILADVTGYNAHQVVALHNNTNGGNYSIESYMRGGNEERSASEVYRSPNFDADDFFFVTSRQIFNALMAKGFNVALQGDARDDGSFSIFAARHGIPYVNVEAQPEHKNEQLLMLRELARM